MPRLALATIVAAVLAVCAVAVASNSAPIALSPVDIAGPALAVAALALSAVAAIFAIYAAIRTRRTQDDVERLARSMDSALRRLSESHARNTTQVGALADAIERDIGGLMERLESRSIVLPDAPVEHLPGNVVLLPATSPKLQPIAASEPARIDWKLRSPIEISLQPIVAISTGAVSGFEVFARLLNADGTETEIQRLSGDIATNEVARFERALMQAAVEASRRQIGIKGHDLPLHVAVSEALLGDPDAVGETADLFRLHPAIARCLILSLPTELYFSALRAQADAVAALGNAGAVFAAEGLGDGHDHLARLGDRGVAVLKLDARHLLDGDAPSATAPGSRELVQAAKTAGLTILASGVATDEDAVGLIDCGVDLMVGARFSGPRRLRSPVPAPASEAVGL